MIDPAREFLELFPCCPFVAWWSRSAGSGSSTARRCRCARARRSAWWAATAPARPRSCGCSAAPTGPGPGSSSAPALTGYLSQDPRSDAVPDDTTVLAHVLLRPRARRRSWRAPRSCGSRWRRTPRRRTSSASAPRRSSSRRPVGTPPRRRCASSPTARSARAIASTSTSARCRAVSGGALELVRILFGGSELLLLDEPTNHLDADARTWLLKFLRSYRGALLVVSHDLDLLDEAITRVVHIDRGVGGGHRRARRVQGHLLPVPRRRAKATRNAPRSWPNGRRARSRGSRRRPAACAARPPSGRASPRTSTSAGPSSKREPVQNTAKRRALAVRFPEPPSAGRTVLTATELWKSFGALDVFADVSFDVGRGERLLVMGLNGAGKTTLLKVLADELSPDLGEVELGHARVGRLLRAGARGHRRRTHAARAHARGVDRGRRRAAQPARHVRAERRQGVPGRRHALGRREDEARAGAARRRHATTCCCSTSPPTTSIPRRAPRRARRSRRGPAR